MDMQSAIEAASKPVEAGERVFGIGIILFSAFMLFLLITHLSQKTGFFTRELTRIELVLLLGYWIAWIITATLDSLLNQRLLSRLFDSFGGILFLAISSLYFFFEFPFDFTQFASVLPESLQFTVGWITNNFVRVITGLGGLALLFAVVYSPIAYKLVVFGASK